MKLMRSGLFALFFTYTLVLSAYAAVGLLQGRTPPLSWLGLLLSGAAPAVFFVRVYFDSGAGAAGRALAVSIVAGLGLAMTMAQSWRFSEAAGSIHLLAGGSLAGWAMYLRWQSARRRSSTSA